MRLKILKGNIPVVTNFLDMPDLADNKVFLNEFLAKEVHKLLRLELEQRLVIMKGFRLEMSRSSSEKAPTVKLYQFRPSAT